jgi:hypothetical protein
MSVDTGLKLRWHAPELIVLSEVAGAEGGGIPAPPEDVFFSS